MVRSRLEVRSSDLSFMEAVRFLAMLSSYPWNLLVKVLVTWKIFTFVLTQKNISALVIIQYF